MIDNQEFLEFLREIAKKAKEAGIDQDKITSVIALATFLIPFAILESPDFIISGVLCHRKRKNKRKIHAASLPWCIRCRKNCVYRISQSTPHFFAERF